MGSSGSAAGSGGGAADEELGWPLALSLGLWRVGTWFLMLGSLFFVALYIEAAACFDRSKIVSQTGQRPEANSRWTPVGAYATISPTPTNQKHDT
jgi:hypothetical protein